jgi:hypothetical protein
LTTSRSRNGQFSRELVCVLVERASVVARGSSSSFGCGPGPGQTHGIMAKIADDCPRDCKVIGHPAAAAALSAGPDRWRSFRLDLLHAIVDRLPVMAMGSDICASHAGPAYCFRPDSRRALPKDGPLSITVMLIRLAGWGTGGYRRSRRNPFRKSAGDFERWVHTARWCVDTSHKAWKPPDRLNERHAQRRLRAAYENADYRNQRPRPEAGRARPRRAAASWGLLSTAPLNFDCCGCFPLCRARDIV